MRRLMIGLLAVVLCGTAWAADYKLPPGKWWENEHLVEKLDLTAEQQHLLRETVFDHARRMIDLNAAVKRAELELTDLLDRSQIANDDARRAFGALQKARRDLENERFELLLSVRQVMTADQWTELHDLRREVMRRRSEGQRPIRPRGGGQPRSPR